MDNIFENKYKEELEGLLEKKRYKEEVKNLLLSMLYKIENSYKDYKSIKVNVVSEKEYIEKLLCILKYECRNIELVNKESGSIKVDKKYDTLKTFANEKDILYSLYKLDDFSLKIGAENKELENKIKIFIEEAVAIDMSEILRDFNGWSWDISIKDIKNIEYNFIYQTIKILIENTEIEIVRKYNISFIIKMLKEKYGQEIIENYFDVIKDILFSKRIKQEQLEMLQKYFLYAFEVKVQNAKNKEEISKLICEFRYFLMQPITKKFKADSFNKDIISKIKLNLISKAIDNNMIKIISNSKYLQYKIIEGIFELKVVDLKRINVSAQKQKNEYKIVYYDGKIEEKTKIIEIKDVDKEIKRTRIFKVGIF